MALRDSRYQMMINVTSLVLGPLVMSLGDLIHPKESLDTTDQAVIIVEHASRWYAAHLMLFLGILILIPGIQALTSLTEQRSAWAAHAAKRLILVGAASFAAIFGLEMLAGRYVSDGADAVAAADLLDTIQSGWVFGPMVAGAVAFALGLILFAVPLFGDRYLRWPAIAFLVGFLLIVGEIVSAQVLLSQISNVVLFLASTACAWRLLRDAGAVSAGIHAASE
jgi:hypothetical protein